MTCRLQETGAIELYFYGELDAADRERIALHVRECRECAIALEELRMIRAALASRSDVSAPPSGDWSPFMSRLDAALLASRTAPDSNAPPAVIAFEPRKVRVRSYSALLAMAALLAVVTLNIVFVASQRPNPRAAPVETVTAPETQPDVAPTIAATGLRAAGEKHFERSKLVVLGLAERDTASAAPEDWAYERELATSLLNDTRLYRMAAEQSGLTGLAGVMRDLELVLLETSMAEGTDPAALEQIQRLIRKRGLVTKMNTVASAGM